MNVTKPETITALWYLAWTANERNIRNTVVAIMLASAKDSTLYTTWNWKSVISYITHWLVAKVPAKTLVVWLVVKVPAKHWLVVTVPATTPVAGFNFTHWLVVWLVVKVPAKTPVAGFNFTH